MSLPIGSFPTMITPFMEDGDYIDFVCVDALVEWYINSGCVGIFTVCLSSEMYLLTEDEKIQLVKRVKSATKGRVPVVACGTFVNNISEQAALIKKMHPHCDAVVLITNQIVKQHQSDDEFIQNASKLVELTPGIPLGLYECPEPYRRVLSPRILQWAVKTGRFIFFKDTCSDLNLITQKLYQINFPNTPLRLYNANVETLLPSCISGASGFSGISANFFPWIHVFLIESVYSKQWSSDKILQEKVKRVQNFLSLAENVVADAYPTSVKYYLNQHYNSSFPVLTRKNRGYKLTEIQKIKLNALYEMQCDLCKNIGIQGVPLKITTNSSL